MRSQHARIVHSTVAADSTLDTLLYWIKTIFADCSAYGPARRVGLEGTIRDNKLTFSFHADVQRTALTVTYTGTVESKDALKGSVDIGGTASSCSSSACSASRRT